MSIESPAQQAAQQESPPEYTSPLVQYLREEIDKADIAAQKALTEEAAAQEHAQWVGIPDQKLAEEVNAFIAQGGTSKGLEDRFGERLKQGLPSSKLREKAKDVRAAARHAAEGDYTGVRVMLETAIEEASAERDALRNKIPAVDDLDRDIGVRLNHAQTMLGYIPKTDPVSQARQQYYIEEFRARLRNTPRGVASAKVDEAEQRVAFLEKAYKETERP